MDSSYLRIRLYWRVYSHPVGLASYTEGGPITEATQAIGDKAAEAGYDAIRFASQRGAGTNYAILGNFNTLLSPQMITPLP
jgi:hypothetical protein